MTMTKDWAEAQRLLLKAATDLELARGILYWRGEAPELESDYVLARELAALVALVADGAWSARVRVIRARELLLERDSVRLAMDDLGQGL